MSRPRYKAIEDVSTKPIALPYADAYAETKKPDPQFLYRFDSRSPDEILKAGGFKSWGVNMDLYKHVSGLTQSTHTTGYISTSKSIDALLKAIPAQSGYIYIIKWQATGIDVNAVLGSRSPYPDEEEIAVPLFIPFTDIIEAFPFTKTR